MTDTIVPVKKPALVAVKTAPAPFTIGGVAPRTAETAERRLSMLIWGDAGVGKTTLAMTAPGRKLHLCFDPDGDASISTRTDVVTIPLYQMPYSRVTQFSDTLGVERYLPEFDTVVLDSTTAIAEYTTQYGITVTKGATVDRPSPGAYGVRNMRLIELVRNLLTITGRANKHFILTAHEDSPEKDKEGNLLYISMLLGGKISNGLGHRINEMWFLGDTAAGKRISVRPRGVRKPMKSRMFKSMGASDFIWEFNADTQKGAGIADWFEQWKAAGYSKIDIPAAAKGKGGKNEQS